MPAPPIPPLNLNLNATSGVTGDSRFSNQAGGLVIYPEPDTGASVSRALNQATGSSAGALIFVTSLGLLVGALAVKAFAK